MKRTTLWTGILAGLLCAFGTSAMTIPLQTAPGSTESGGNAVSAQAIFTTSADTLDITLNNLIVDPTTVAQNISDLYFTLDSSVTSGSISSSGGNLIQVNGDGSTTSKGAASSTGWVLSYDASTGFHLNGLGSAANTPAYTILGAPGSGGTYDNAGGSIAGNGPHNPFLDQSATFSLSIPGITANTAVTSATFSFGTVTGNDVPGTPVPDGGTTILLLGAALTGLGTLTRRWKK